MIILDTMTDLYTHMEWADASVWGAVLVHPPAVQDERLRMLLLHLHGVGNYTAAQILITSGGNPDRLRTEASFAALCGTAPVPASSGKTTRHRLSRGGDRRANHALHTIALARMRNHPPTKAFVKRQRDQGRSTPEILRLLKRAIAREMFKQLTRPHQDLGVHDLRPARQAKNITIARLQC